MTYSVPDGARYSPQNHEHLEHLEHLGPADLLAVAGRAGVHISLDGSGGVRLRAAAPPPAALLAALRTQKGNIIQCLEAATPIPPLSNRARAMADRAERAAAAHADRSGWDAGDWRAEHGERAAMASSLAGPVPLEWREGFASLQVARMPKGFDRATWAQVIDDGGRFLDEWGPQAAALRWTGLEVFGVAPGAPISRDEAKGLVMLLQGRPVVALTADSCTIQTRPGNTLRIFRNVGPGAVTLWELDGAQGAA